MALSSETSLGCSGKRLIGIGIRYSKQGAINLGTRMKACKSCLDPYISKINKNESPFLCWSAIEDPISPELQKIAIRLLSLQPSSASVEGLFNGLRCIKTKYRNRMNIRTLEMTAKFCSFEISRNFLTLLLLYHNFTTIIPI